MKRKQTNGLRPAQQDNSHLKKGRQQLAHGASVRWATFFLPSQGVIFFFLVWLWASWWMGDVFRIAYERSFFAPDETLMHWLWQQRLGWLWIIGRALLTIYLWPVAGGLLIAALLTGGSWLLGYCLRVSERWHWVQYLPAAAWMLWVANAGLNLYYRHEPGRILAVPFLVVVLCAGVALVIWLTKHRQQPLIQSTPEPANPARPHFIFYIINSIFLLLFFAFPVLIGHFRHPYMRPLTRMQVQLMHNDFEGISHTAHQHPEMSYRQMAGYYTIALAHTGHLADQLFDIKLDYDTLFSDNYLGLPSSSLNYHILDCNYHAGLFRAARHYAMEQLMMDGPSLFTLKYLAKISLLEGDWVLSRKYFRILHKAPFESEFLRKYEPMAGRPDLVKADPEFAFVLAMQPSYHTFEQMYEKPGFVGYYATLRSFSNQEKLIWSIVACLYSKRMEEFLLRCRRLVGTTPPRSIAEGLLIQAGKDPDILKAFPQLDMLVDRFQLFLQDAMPYMKDRERGSEVLFEKYHGYYPYYYFFGNLRSTRKPSQEEQDHNKAGIN